MRRRRVMTPVTILGAMGGDRNPRSRTWTLRERPRRRDRAADTSARADMSSPWFGSAHPDEAVPAAVRGTTVASCPSVRRAMLRITNGTCREGATLVLEGRLTGPWVDELARCWEALTATRDARSVSIDLDAVTFIDAGGRELLRTMYEAGAVLEACSGCMTRAIVEEITGEG
jgi:ABC-type transporter Mla MlaB component